MKKDTKYLNKGQLMRLKKGTQLIQVNHTGKKQLLLTFIWACKCSRCGILTRKEKYSCPSVRVSIADTNIRVCGVNLRKPTPEEHVYYNL